MEVRTDLTEAIDKLNVMVGNSVKAIGPVARESTRERRGRMGQLYMGGQTALPELHFGAKPEGESMLSTIKSG